MISKHKSLLALWFLIGLTAYGYLAIAIPMCLQFTNACFGENDLAPNRYRVLHPLLEHVFSNGTLSSTMLFDVFAQMLIGALTLIGLYIWLKRNVYGVALFATVWILSYTVYFRAIGTSIELCLIVWFLITINKPLIWQVLIVILASLNRETALIFPFLYLAWNWTENGATRYGALTIVYVCIVSATHLALGSAPHVLGLEGTFSYNLKYFDSGFLSLFLLLPIGIYVVTQYRASMPHFRRLALVAGAYLIAVLIGGAWNESLRLGLPALMLVLPIVTGDK